MQDSRIAKMCVEKGLKMTEPRKVIARVLSDATDHPDADHRKYGAFTLGGGPILTRGP